MTQQEVKKSAISELQRMTNDIARTAYYLKRIKRNSIINLCISAATLIAVIINLCLHLKN